MSESSRCPPATSPTQLTETITMFEHGQENPYSTEKFGPWVIGPQLDCSQHTPSVVIGDSRTWTILHIHLLPVMTFECDTSLSVTVAPCFSQSALSINYGEGRGLKGRVPLAEALSDLHDAVGSLKGRDKALERGSVLDSDIQKVRDTLDAILRHPTAMQSIHDALQGATSQKRDSLSRRVKGTFTSKDHHTPSSSTVLTKGRTVALYVQFCENVEGSGQNRPRSVAEMEARNWI